jgi:DNA-binding NtrC family response regulator
LPEHFDLLEFHRHESHRMPSVSSISTHSLLGIEALVVDADASVRQGLTILLSESKMHVTSVTSATDAATQLAKTFFSVALVDIDTPAPGAGIDTIEMIAKMSPTTMIIAMTPRRSFEDAVAAQRAGAIDTVLKQPQQVPYLAARVLAAAGRSVGERLVDSVLNEVKDSQDDFLARFMAAERAVLDASDASRNSSAELKRTTPKASSQQEPLVMLIVDQADTLFDALVRAGNETNNKATAPLAFEHATSGGEALDRISGQLFHYVLIAENVSDLPVTTLVRTIKTQRPDTVVLTFSGPAHNGKLQLVETNTVRTIVSPFDDSSQLFARMDDLSAAWRAKQKERRYHQAFREKHYDFLRKFVELRTKIERALKS